MKDAAHLMSILCALAALAGGIIEGHPGYGLMVGTVILAAYWISEPFVKRTMNIINVGVPVDPTRDLDRRRI